ncbi:DsbA family oxidoreductase [Bacillus sp. SM2101]|uniref:DsbA family oxidoreductase n=1 Tax=Bacillus sp. SM2101 TaxID=2805366 RepID=UPI001BDF459D|nr:DsbA family oxidoreductase [Bacillus sp. SM2101]
MTVKMKVYSDFVCPFCFLAKKPLLEATSGKDVEIEWMPYELRPGNSEPLRPESNYIQTGWQHSVKPLSERIGVEMVLPEMSPHPRTHLTHEGLQFAKERGKGNEYADAVFRAFWQLEQDISDVEILTSIAENVGLDANEFKESLVSRKYEQVHQKQLQHAYTEANIRAVPTIQIGNQQLSGVQSSDSIERAINKQLETAKTPSTGMNCSIDGCE